MAPSASDPTPSSLRSALPAVLFVAAVFFINYTDRAILGPLLVHMETALGLDHVQASSLLLSLSTGMSIGLLFSGIAASLIRPRLLISFSAMGCGIMLLLLTRAASLAEARLLILGLGLAAGFYLTAAMATLGSLVKSEDWSRTIAVHELAPNISFIVAPLLAESAAALWGWQSGFFIMGCLSLAAGFLFLLFGKGGFRKADRPSASGLLLALRRPVFWGFTWLFGLCVAGEFAPFSILPLSLTAEQHLSSETASRLLAFSRLASPFVVVAGGWATARLGATTCLMLFLLVHGLALCALALPAPMVGLPGLFAAMLGQAMATAFVFPPLFTLLAQSFPLGQQPLLLSIAVPLGTCFGTGFIPLLLGASGQYASFSLGYLVFGLVCLATLPFLRAISR